MYARENLTGFDNASRGAVSHFGKGAASGPVNAGKAKKAMVLGEEGFKIANNTLHNSALADFRLGDNTQLAHWTDEEVISWE